MVFFARVGRIILTKSVFDGIINEKYFPKRGKGSMRVRICDKDEAVVYNRDLICLQRGKLDDFGFRTTFEACYYDFLGRKHPLGSVKIGRQGMQPGWTADHLAMESAGLPDAFFSLGQDDVYYENIHRLGDKLREEILTALQDVAFDLQHFKRYEAETVMKKSLLRSISSFAVNGQLHRMAMGGQRLTGYHFSYLLPGGPKPARIDFEVLPESNPPTNVHVLIGRNGTGKTRLLKSMIRSIRFGDSKQGKFQYMSRCGGVRKSEFANILCVAFSPFDDFSEVEAGMNSAAKDLVPWSFIGLNKQLIGTDKQYDSLHQAVAEQFFEAFKNCMVVSWKRRLWHDAIEILKTDTTFRDEQIDTLAPDKADLSEGVSMEDRKDEIMEVFSRLSSGHKVVLLIVTGCVDKIEEQSVLFLDEPENHLHPPLLSALIRALSNLLTSRNGVAIISTHSPVVLQEVPASCVWALRRNGSILSADRPGMQTFGASIGALTNEVFGLEVTETGFHNLLREAVRQLGDFEPSARSPEQSQNDYMTVAGHFKKQLGDEADLLLRTLLLLRRKGIEI